MKHSNDNIPILRRHPRLLVTPVQKGGCSRQQDADRNAEYTEQDVSRELAMIEMRLRWLNLLEWTLRRPNKRIVADNDQVVLSAGRSGASRTN